MNNNTINNNTINIESRMETEIMQSEIMQSETMETEIMETEIMDKREPPYCQYCDNDTLEDQFMYEIDLAIEYGNASHIQQSIKKFTGIISPQFIEIANNILYQLVVEQIEEINFN